MASYTPNLNLLKKSPVTDGNDTFNVDTMLNGNWDKIDNFLGNNSLFFISGYKSFSFEGSNKTGTVSVSLGFKPEIVLILPSSGDAVMIPTYYGEKMDYSLGIRVFSEIEGYYGSSITDEGFSAQFKTNYGSSIFYYIAICRGVQK